MGSRSESDALEVLGHGYIHAESAEKTFPSENSDPLKRLQEVAIWYRPGNLANLMRWPGMRCNHAGTDLLLKFAPAIIVKLTFHPFP